jgi:hypothetical protein
MSRKGKVGPAAYLAEALAKVDPRGTYHSPADKALIPPIVIRPAGSRALPIAGAFFQEARNYQQIQD